VAHVDLRRSWDPEELTSAVDHQLPPDCACLGARPVTADFHAAHDALSKTYTYRLDRSQPRNPLLARHSWRPPCTWNGELLHAAAQPLVGSHDMRALARSGDHREDFRVSISAASWAIDAQAATFTITANRFVWRLVRSLVGAQVHVASGAASIDELIAALGGTANGVARQQAPARGLCLESIDYGRAP
jgi:tRNA pseudouridine38-40 synthase